jgi:hypothetical protein
MVNVAFPVAMVPVPSVAVPSLNVTVPVAVEGVTVAVNFTEAPKVEGLREEAKATVEFALLTVCVRAVDVLLLKFVSPP